MLYVFLSFLSFLIIFCLVLSLLLIPSVPMIDSILIGWEDLLYAKSISREQEDSIGKETKIEMNKSANSADEHKESEKATSAASSQSQLIQSFYDDVVAELLSQWNVKDGYCMVFVSQLTEKIDYILSMFFFLLYFVISFLSLITIKKLIFLS